MQERSSAKSADRVDALNWRAPTLRIRFGAPLLSLALFTLLVAVFAASPVTTPTDSRWAVHTAMSIAKGHGGDLSEYLALIEKHNNDNIEYPDGRPRNIYPIGPSLLAVPAVVVSAWLRPEWAEGLRYDMPVQTEQFIASLVGAAAGVVFYWVILSQFQSQAIALASTAIFSFGTSMWSTATRALWQHGPLVLMLVIAMLLLVRARQRPQLVQYLGLPVAMAYLMRPTAIVAILVFSTYVLFLHRPWFVRYLCWAMLVAVPWLGFNLRIYHHLVPAYYHNNAFSGQARFVSGLLGNLFSPSRGLFVFSPVLLFALSGFVLALRDRELRPLTLAYGAIIAGNLIIIGEAWMWWGGHSYGPRFMTDVVPFLVYFTAFNFRLPETFRHRTQVTVSTVIAVLALASAAIHAQGALRRATWQWNASPINIDEAPTRAWDWRDPQFARTEPK
ncbi:MAG: glycosyltransferase family 39 protein [Deltaproteobacteria bacterium]|nr:glycosyltransferase family 39 protein [Deltaproteobacteria bacterium]